MTNAIEGAAREDHPAEGSARGATSEASEDRAESRTPITGEPVASISGAIRAGTRFVVRVVDRIVNGIRCIAPLVLGLSCQSTNDATIPAPAAASAAPAAKEVPAETGPRQLGKFTITFYYVIGEDEVKPKPVTQVRAFAAEQ